MDEAPRRGSRRQHLKLGAVSGLLGLLAAVGVAVAAAAVTDHGASAEYDLHFTADDADGATTDGKPLVPADAAGTAVPDKQYQLLSGGLGSLADHRGTPLVVNFWQSTCAPCRTEMPALQQVHEELGDRVAFVGLDVNERESAARDFVKATGVTYETGLDKTGYFVDALRVVSYPTTVLVDRQGRVVATHLGAVTAAELRALIADNLS